MAYETEHLGLEGLTAIVVGVPGEVTTRVCREFEGE